MSVGGLLSGGGKVDTSAYDEAIRQAQEQTAKAQQEAEDAKNQQREAQSDIVEGNKVRRANASSRFSLLLFEDDEDGTLGV